MKGGLCCQPGSSTWDPGRKDPTLELLVSYLIAWSKHLRPWKSVLVCSPLQYRRGDVSTSSFVRGMLQHPSSSNSNNSIWQEIRLESKTEFSCARGLWRRTKTLPALWTSHLRTAEVKKGKSIGREEICPDPNLQRYQEYSKKTRLNNPVFAIGSYEQIPKPSDTKASTFIKLILVPSFRERYLWQN